MTSAAAFVEGGIQESCDDACSICLEEFCQSDPSTVIFTFVSQLLFHKYKRTFAYLPSLLLQFTACRHEFHLQCILEWYILIFNNFSCLFLKIQIHIKCFQNFCNVEYHCYKQKAECKWYRCMIFLSFLLYFFFEGGDEVARLQTLG